MKNLIRLAALATFACGLAAAPALADDMRAQAPYGEQQQGGYGGAYVGAPIGVNQYCPPGEVPHSYPNGNGVRCQTLDGDYR